MHSRSNWRWRGATSSRIRPTPVTSRAHLTEARGARQRPRNQHFLARDRAGASRCTPCEDRTVERFARRWAALRQTPRYASLALTILRDEGGDRAGASRRAAHRGAAGAIVPASGTLYRQETEVLPLAFAPCIDTSRKHRHSGVWQPAVDVYLSEKRARDGARGTVRSPGHRRCVADAACARARGSQRRAHRAQ